MYQMLGATDMFGRSPLFFLPSGSAPARFPSMKDADDRHLQRQWLKGIAGAFAGAAAFALVLSAGSVRPLDATVQLERLADKVERAQALKPEAAEEIARLARQPWYDCTKVACTPQLAARNAQARTRLSDAVAQQAPMDVAAKPASDRSHP